MKKDLLTYVYEKSGFAYLSDLKFADGEKLAALIEGIDAVQFDAHDWNELYLYMIGNVSEEDDVQLIKMKLLDELVK